MEKTLGKLVSRSRPFPFYYAEEGKGRLRETRENPFYKLTGTVPRKPLFERKIPFSEKAGQFILQQIQQPKVAFLKQ